MNKKIIVTTLTCILLLSACGKAGKEEPKVDKNDAIAVVNGQYISKTDLEQLTKEVQQRARGRVFPAEKLIEELIQREILVQEADKMKLAESLEFTTKLESIKKQLLTQALLKDYIQNNVKL